MNDLRIIPIEPTKKPNLSIEYSDEKISELLKCTEDPLYFIKNYMTIQHPLKGSVPFKPFPYQERMIKGFADHRFGIYLLSRQTGKTTSAGAFLLWKAMFTPDCTILIVAHNYNGALEIMNRVRYGYETTPDFLRPGITEYNKGSIAFDNGSRIISRATSSSAARGLSITLLYADELGFVQPNIAKEFWAAVRPTLSCVAGGTMLLTEQGYQQIDGLHFDHQVGEYLPIANSKVFGVNGLEDVSHGYVSEESETIIIETARGHRLEVTKNHPLYSLVNDRVGMAQAENLRLYDCLRISYGMNIYGHDHSLIATSVKTLTPDLAYMVGGMVAEGWIGENIDQANKNEVSICNTDDDFRNMFLQSPYVVPFKLKKGRYDRLVVNSRELVALYREIGFNPKWKCDTKRVPVRILTASKEVQCAFLQGLFDGDGCAGGSVVNLSSTSRLLLQDVQLMLANMGIISTIFLAMSKEKAMSKPYMLPQGRLMKTARDAYALTVSGAQRTTFANLIGFKIKRKMEELYRRIETEDGYINHRSSSVFMVPKNLILLSRMKSILANTGKTVGWFRRAARIRLDKPFQSHTGDFTQNMLQKFYAAIIEHNLPISQADQSLLEQLKGPDFLWERIVSISTGRAITYDLTVPSSHTFLQNGILGSNTGGSCIITSTPKSDTDQFAEIWKEANNKVDEFGNDTGLDIGANGFFPLKVIWSEHPERDEKWAEIERGSMGDARFRQEHCCEFVTDDLTLIDPIFLSEMKHTEPISYTGTVRWYKAIEPNKTYLAALDPSFGTGSDYSAIEVFELPGMAQVAEWSHNRTQLKDQVAVLKDVLHTIDDEMRAFPVQRGDPQIFWTVENNNMGAASVTVIGHTGEENFPGMFLSEKRKRGISRAMKGMLTTGSSKKAACVRFKSLVETHRMTIHSQPLIKELKSFVTNANSASAKPGEHDDLVSATLLCVRMLEQVTAWDEAFEELHEVIKAEEGGNDPPAFVF